MTDAPLPAAQALAGVAELPRATAGVAPSAPTDAAAPPASGGQVDAAGVAFDPALHESAAGVPRRKGDGTWQLKRGNGARKAAGTPLLNLFGGGKPKANAAAPAAPPAAPSPPPPSTSFIADDAPATGGPTPGASGAVVDGVPSPEGPRPIEAYDATAAGLTHAMFAVAQLLFGPAWEAATAEHKAWVDANRRVLHHFQLPILGPFIEWLVLALTTAAKRRNDPTTIHRVTSAWRWLTGGPFRQPAPQAERETSNG